MEKDALSQRHYNWTQQSGLLLDSWTVVVPRLWSFRSLAVVIQSPKKHTHRAQRERKWLKARIVVEGKARPCGEGGGGCERSSGERGIEALQTELEQTIWCETLFPNVITAPSSPFSLAFSFFLFLSFFSLFFFLFPFFSLLFFSSSSLPTSKYSAPAGSMLTGGDYRT